MSQKDRHLASSAEDREESWPTNLAPPSPWSSDVTGAQVIGNIQTRSRRRRRMLSTACSILLLGLGYHFFEPNLSIENSTQNTLAKSHHQLSTERAITAHDQFNKKQLTQFHHTLSWLQAEQLPNGTWDVKKWGGKERFTIGISSIAVLSLLQGAPEAVDQNRITLTLDHLLSQQDEHGLFGPAFVGDLYNHSIALLALKRAKQQGFAISSDCIARGEQHLLGFKTPEGSWAYRPGLQAENNLSQWAALALDTTYNGASIHTEDSKHTNDLKHTEGLAHREKNIKSRVRRPNHHELDLLNIYFSPELKQSHVDHIMALQVKKGELQGTWAPQGKWAHIGGRIYSTSLSLLCMHKAS